MNSDLYAAISGTRRDAIRRGLILRNAAGPDTTCDERVVFVLNALMSIVIECDDLLAEAGAIAAPGSAEWFAARETGRGSETPMDTNGLRIPC